MRQKRRNDPASAEGEPYQKRPRPSHDYLEGDDENSANPTRSQPRVDPTYGQREVFPGLVNDGDELFYGPASDGMEYLRMVRYAIYLPTSRTTS